jgi:hypothetical protein
VSCLPQITEELVCCLISCAIRSNSVCMRSMKQTIKFSHCIGSRSLNTHVTRKSLKILIHQLIPFCRNVHHHFSMRWLDVLSPATMLRVPTIGSVESCLKYCYNSTTQFPVPTSQRSIWVRVLDNVQ